MKSFSIGISAQSLVSVYNLETSIMADHDLTVDLDIFGFCSSQVKAVQGPSDVFSIRNSEICPELLLP